jgi:hypothetical protein
VLWNTVYIERAIDASTRNGQVLDVELLKYLSPLGWEHINLTGDYQWRGKRLAQGRFRPLRIPTPLSVLYCPFSDGTPTRPYTCQDRPLQRQRGEIVVLAKRLCRRPSNCCGGRVPSSACDRAAPRASKPMKSKSGRANSEEDAATCSGPPRLGQPKAPSSSVKSQQIGHSRPQRTGFRGVSRAIRKPSRCA